MIKKILVVDDDPGVRFTVKSGLETLDETYKDTTVESGLKCIDYLKSENEPDLILLDIMMPEMSGWLTFDKIRENPNWNNIPIIFLSARTDQNAKNAGNFLGEDFIEKPAKIPDLKRKIEETIFSNRNKDFK